MKLLIKQEHANYYLKDNETTELLYGGAAGGAKSTFGCLWLIECCQKYPGSRWLMGRSKLKTLKETTLATFFDTIKKLGVQDQFKYNDNNSTLTHENGSVILLKDLFRYPSDPDFDSLGSLEITGAFIDECNQIVFKAWQVVKSRIRYRLDEFGLIPKLLGTCNPAKNWVYKVFYKAKKLKTIEPYRKFIQALPTDNPHLPSSYIESLLQLDKNSRDRLYYGNWEYDDDPATIIEQDAIIDYFNPVHIKEDGKRYLTIDVARKGKDHTVFRIWYGNLCVERISLPKTLVTETVEEARKLQKKHSIPNSQTIADEDGVGGGVVDMLKCKGFINNASPVKGENYGNLKDQCSIKMGQAIQAREFGERCEETGIKDRVGEEMEQVKIKDIDKDGKLRIVPKETVKEMIGRSPDDWDSIMMRYWFELKVFSGEYYTANV